MYPDRGVEEDLFGEAGAINDSSVFLKHLHAGNIKVIRGEYIACVELPVHDSSLLLCRTVEQEFAGRGMHASMFYLGA